jgi:hypothetical protein
MLREFRIRAGFDVCFVIEDENFRPRRSLVNRQNVSVLHHAAPIWFNKQESEDRIQKSGEKKICECGCSLIILTPVF